MMKAVLLFAAIWIFSTAYAAESDRPLAELIQERQKIFAEIESYKKENEKAVEALNKLPAVAEWNVKQKVLNEKWQKANARINELNGQIAEKVSKDKK